MSDPRPLRVLQPSSSAALSDAELSLLSASEMRANICEGIGLWLVEEPPDEQIEAAITLAERRLVPAGRTAAVAAMDLCLEVLHSKRPGPQAIEVYATLLADLPADLLGQAVRHSLSVTTHHLLPAPGVFLTAVQEPLARRRELLATLRRHAGRLSLARQRRFFSAIGA